MSVGTFQDKDEHRLSLEILDPHYKCVLQNPFVQQKLYIFGYIIMSSQLFLIYNENESGPF